MITFRVTKDNIIHEFTCSLEDNILSLKKQIMKTFKLSCQYVDIDFLLERPIRSLGKFNLEPGILPRSLDNYSFDRYELDGRTIEATFMEVDDYKVYRPMRHKTIHSSNNELKYKLNHKDEEDSHELNNFNLDLTSDVDFPILSGQGMGRGRGL
jgi:hypothetical protein